MNNQLKRKDVQEKIDHSGFDFTLEKVGKKWSCDERLFDNLSQVSGYIDNISRIEESGSVEKTKKQGEEGIEINPRNILVLQQTFRAPIPSKTKDKSATKKLHDDGGFGTVVKNQLEIVPKLDSKGKQKKDFEGNLLYKLPEELNKVQAIKNRYMSVLDKYCLQYEIQGNRIVSVHHIDYIKDAINQANSELQKLLSEILSKLPDWKKESQRLNLYVPGKFPTKEYFSERYRVSADFLKLGETFEFESDVRRNSFSEIKKYVENFIESISGFLNGDTKKFRDSYIQNLSESVKVLKDSGIIRGEKVDNIISMANRAIEETDTEEIRKAKQRIDKGVVDPSKNVGRGRKPKAVTKDDLEKDRKFLGEALEPLEELKEELEGIV